MKELLRPCGSEYLPELELVGLSSDLWLKNVHGFAQTVRVLLARPRAAVVVIMSLAFVGKGFGALGWTVVSDTSPRAFVGINRGPFKLFGEPNRFGLVDCDRPHRRSHGVLPLALVLVAATALMAIVGYLPIVGEIKRLETPPPSYS